MKAPFPTIGAWQRCKNIFTNHESLDQLISNGSVGRTAPATPGLLYLYILYFYKLAILICIKNIIYYIPLLKKALTKSTAYGTHWRVQMIAPITQKHQKVGNLLF